MKQNNLFVLRTLPRHEKSYISISNYRLMTNLGDHNLMIGSIFMELRILSIFRKFPINIT